MRIIMNQFRLKSSIFCLSLLFFLSQGDSLSSKCSKINEEIIVKNIPVTDFKILSGREVGGLCEIVININGRIIPLYGNENFLISGDMFSLKKNMTSEKIYEVRKNLFLQNRDAIDKSIAFVYTPPVVKSKKIIYMFTEPLCSYCHKAGGELKQMADDYGFVVKVLLASMSGGEGKRKCIEAACRHFSDEEKFNLEEYNHIAWKKERADEKYICEKGVKLIELTEATAETVAVDGVPFFFTSTGDYVSGADLDALKLLVESD